MCGRYALVTDLAALRALFGFEESPNLPPRWNIAPTTDVPIIGLRDGRPALKLARWGLVPRFAADLAGPPLFNARAETAAEKPAFRAAYAKRRCLVPADCFYEWRPGDKQAFRVGLAPDWPIFVFAGLWERWTRPDGGALDSMAILTTAASGALAAIHARAPVILRPADHAAWLAGPGPEDARLLSALPDDALRLEPIGPAVGSVRNDGPELWAPVTA